MTREHSLGIEMTKVFNDMLFSDIFSLLLKVKLCLLGKLPYLQCVYLVIFQCVYHDLDQESDRTCPKFKLSYI